MKLVYVHRYADNIDSGMNKKVITQCLTLIKLGYNVKLLLLSNNDAQIPCGYPYDLFIEVDQIEIASNTHLLKKIIVSQKIANILKREINSLNDDDIIYTRYPFPLLFCRKNFLKRYRSCKLVFEHNTIESYEFRSTKNYFDFILDYIFGKLLINQTSGVVGVTDEITNYEVSRIEDSKKPHVTIGNGFNVRSVPLKKLTPFDDRELRLLCVANVSRWHGLDRLLQGLATYNGMPKVILHIAGDGAELPHLQKLAGDLSISDRVVFHGFTTGKALDALFDRCHIAVGSLGIHRIGLKEASILKAREYCARGVPFIYGISDPDFPADFPYILHLPADESPIEIDQVLAFAKRVCTDPDHPQKMRRYAEEHLDWSVKMKRLKGFLETLVRENGGGSVLEPSTSSLIPMD